MIFKFKFGKNSKTKSFSDFSKSIETALPKAAKFWSPKEYDWKYDRRGFHYRIYMNHLNRVVAETDTDFQDWLMEVHYTAMKNTPSLIVSVKSAHGMTSVSRMAIEVGRFRWNITAAYRRLILLFPKSYKQNAENNKDGDKIMSTENKDVIGMFNWNVEAGKAYSKISDAFADLTTLTITTNGKLDSKGKPTTFMKTEIKLLTGDITSDTPFEGEKLESYHKTMFDLSLNITKTYAQIVIQLLSILLPWSGLAVPKEALTQINDLAKDMFKTEKSGT